MKRKHQKTLDQIHTRPTSANIAWSDIESLFVGLGADVSERAGSRVAIVLLVKFACFIDPTPLRKQTKGL